MLEQGLADALGHATVHLAFHDHRVHQGAEVVHGNEVHDLHDARLRVDLHLADVAAGWKIEVRRIEVAALLQARLDLVGVEVVGGVGVEGDLREAQTLVGLGACELSFFEAHAFSGYVQYLGGDELRLGDHLVARDGDGREAHGTRAGAEGPHAELNLVRVAVDDVHVLDGDVEPVGDKLGVGRFVALTVAVAAGKHLDGTGGVHPHLCGFPQPRAGSQLAQLGRRTDAGGLDVGADAQTP